MVLNMAKGNIRVLYIGDVCGKPGRQALSKLLSEIRKQERVDVIVTNIENLAHGRGATVDTVREIMSYGVDFMTAGNHIWRRPDFEELLSGNFPVVRAINYPKDIPGKGYDIIDLGEKGRLLIAEVQGRAFIQDNVTLDMIRPLDEMLSEVEDEDLAGIIVEIHAEATSEKIATALYLDGRVSAVVGTHTHIPTADERILPKGTAFIADIGMVGVMNSSLWVKPEIVQQQLKYPYAPSYEIEEDGECRFDSVLIDINGPASSSKISRVNRVV
jgi:hypothetical protein